MPGGHRTNYDFRNGTPALLKIAFAILFTNFVVNFSVGIWASQWAPRYPFGPNSYPFRFKGGIVVYLRPAVGHYLVWGFWAHFALLAFIFLLFWIYEKTGRAIRVR
jgi:hypothetical protein